MFFFLFLKPILANPIPVYALPNRCLDPRYPTLHQGWVIGCDSAGLVDRAYHIQSMKTVYFDEGREFVGLGSGVQLGSAGVFNIERQTRDKTVRIRNATAPPIYSSERWGYTTQNEICIQKGRVTQKSAANPRGWYPPAWWKDSLVWVEDDGKGGEDLWLWNPSQGSPKALWTKGGNQRHPISKGARLAWVEDNRIGLWEDTELKFIESVSVVDRLALSQDRICWSQKNQGEDIDIYCHDGFVLKRSKHQTWPVLWKDYLLFREDGLMMLYQFSKK